MTYFLAYRESVRERSQVAPPAAHIVKDGIIDRRGPSLCGRWAWPQTELDAVRLSVYSSRLCVGCKRKLRQDENGYIHDERGRFTSAKWRPSEAKPMDKYRNGNKIGHWN